jgi:hypothetical protein
VKSVIYVLVVVFLVVFVVDPVTVAEPSKAWPVFARSDAAILGCQLGHGYLACLCVYSLFVLSCV